MLHSGSFLVIAVVKIGMSRGKKDTAEPSAYIINLLTGSGEASLPTAQLGDLVPPTRISVRANGRHYRLHQI